jgi:hypothetical protein
MNQTLIQLPGLKKPFIYREIAMTDKTRMERNTDRYLYLAIALDAVWLNLCLFGFLLVQISYNQGFEPAVMNTLPYLVLCINVIWLLTATFTNVYQVFEGVKLNLKIKDLFWSVLIYLGLISLVYFHRFSDPLFDTRLFFLFAAC